MGRSGGWFRVVTFLCATGMVATGALAQDPDYVMILDDVTAEVGDQVVVPFRVGTSDLEIHGFSAGMCDDGTLVGVIDFQAAPLLAQMNGGAGPDFLSFSLDPIGGSGVTCGTVFSFTGAEVISPGPAEAVVILTYESFATEPTDTLVSLCNTLGLPVVEANVVVTTGASIAPTLVDGTVTFVEGTDFVRGDSNADDTLGIADPIYSLNYLFLNGPSVCLNAMDFNADSHLDLSDVLAQLFYLNAMGPSPGPPFPDCGISSPGIGCDSYPACP